MLSNHKNEREIVHAQSNIEELVGINEKDEILDGVFNRLKVSICVYGLRSYVLLRGSERLTTNSQQNSESSFIVRG